MNRCMRRAPRVLAVITLVAAGTAAAAGQNLGTNLPEGYPDPACGEPPAVPDRS